MAVMATRMTVSMTLLMMATGERTMGADLTARRAGLRNERYQTAYEGRLTEKRT